MSSDAALDAILSQIAVQLCAKQAVASVTDALAAHSRVQGHATALRMLLPSGTGGRRPARASDCCVLYTVEGVFSDTSNDGRSQIFVLDDTTAQRHRTHAALRRTMRYAIVIATPAAAIGGGGAFAPSALDTSADAPVEVTLAGVVDCSPSSAIMKHYKGGLALASRPSALMAYATDVIASVERGTVGCDLDTALSNCCLWLVESLNLAEKEFRRHLAVSTSALAIVEAFQKRYAATQTVLDVLTAPSSVAVRLEAHAAQSGQGYQRWAQRKAQLLLLTEQRRVEATWLSMLAHPLLTLHLTQTRASQMLQPLAELVPRLCLLLQLVAFAYPAAGSDDSSSAEKLLLLDGEYSESVRHALGHRICPQIANTLVQKCGEMVGFSTLFSVQAVPDREEIQGYVLPVCSRDAVQAGLRNSIDLLQLFASTFRWTSGAFIQSFPVTFAAGPASSPSISPLVPISDTTDIATQSTLYAANRLADLLRMIAQVDAAGAGMASQEVLCLYQTMHTGATSFDLLLVDEFKNWQLFTDNFEKTLVLKYVKEEVVRYVPLPTPAAAAPPTAAAAAAASAAPYPPSPSPSGSGALGGSVDRAVADEERAILSSRVTVLTSELADCRYLLQVMAKQLEQSQLGLKEAQQLNVMLLMELQRTNILSATGNGTELGMVPTPYQALVDAMANEGQ